MNEFRHDLGTGRFWRHFATSTFSGIGALAVMLGLVGLFFPDVLTGRGRWLWLFALVASAVYGIWRSWPRPIEEAYFGSSVKVRLIKADLLEEQRNLVIGTCDTFDTSVPEVIARTSVQAQFLERVYNNDVKRLDVDIEAALNGVKDVGTVEKAGKTTRYPVGTVAVLKDLDRKFFLVAYTEMSPDNEAHATVDGIWGSLSALWSAVSREANGGAVAIPVIGGGQARVGQVLPAQDSIRFIALSFVLASRRQKFCDELRIVVRPKEYEKLDRLEIQAFLTSLRAS